MLSSAVLADGVQRLDSVEVTGHYGYGIGTSDAASAGFITPQLIDDRPLLRPGEVLEYVPGMIVTQHSGAGKANQYFLRGFNLDHGTDFATTVAGMPVNFRTHAHGQGYTDLNFMIPELVARIDYYKGPYYAAQGDFATAGSADIHYADALPAKLAALGAGSYGYARALLAGSLVAGPGTLLYGLEAFHDDGPWEVPQDYRKANGVLRFTLPVGEGRAGLTAMAYHGRWTATDQIAKRAVDEGLVGRFGSLNDSDGGDSSRASLAVDWKAPLAGGSLQATLYGIRYDLDLYSDFTYYLDDPTNGDQFNQSDHRRVYGFNGSYARAASGFGKSMQNTLGWDLRRDDILPVALYSTVRRERISTTREDRVHETSYAAYAENSTEWTDTLRTVAGLRVDRFDFDVASNIPQNSGRASATLASPKLSVIATPWKTTELFANAGFGYHSNDARGVTSTVDPKTGEPIDKATPLARAKGAEIGVRTEAIARLQSSLSLWYLHLASELVFSGDEGTTEATRPSKRVGIEWSNRYAPASWLLVDLDAAWTRARFAADDPVGNYIPDALQGTIAAGATVHDVGPWTASLFVRYFSPRPLIEDNSVRANSTTLWNAQATWKYDARTRLRFDLFNIFDTKADDITYYYTSRLPGEPAEGVADKHFHPVEGRTARLVLLYNF